MKKTGILFLMAMSFSVLAVAVPFTLRNNSLKSIYLEIPGVMNPNLSPVSNSSVDLKVGQKIYFFEDGKKGAFKKRYLLLEVTEALKDQKIDVEKLIRQRKEELGL